VPGSMHERAAFAALDGADRKRRITVVIHGHDAMARDWGMRRLREVLVRDETANARPHAVIALPGGDAWVRQVASWAPSQGLPLWAPDRRAVGKTAAAGELARGDVGMTGCTEAPVESRPRPRTAIPPTLPLSGVTPSG
jgi:hypothetical protein